MLEIISPVALVHGSINVVVHSIAVGLIVDPLSVIDIPINMNELSFSMGSVVLPLSFVLCTIWPLLDTIAISEASNPFSFIGSASLEGKCLSLLPLGIGVVLPCLRDSFPALIDSKVPGVSL
jgi:hypothetical protein